KAKQDLQGEKRALEKEKREFDEVANDLAKAKQEMEGAKKELEQKTREFEETMNELEKEKQDLQDEKRALEKEKKSIDEERRDLAEAKRGRFEERCQEKANKVNAEERRKVEEKEVSLVEREEGSQLEERDMREKEVGELISELNSQRAFFLEKSKTWKAEQEKVRGQLKETEQIMAEQMARWQTRERTIMEEFTRLQEAKEEVERRYASLQEQLSLMEERTAQPLADALEALEEAKRREEEQMGELERERRERQQIEKDYERLAQQNSELTQHVAESRGLKERLEHLQSELLKWRRIGEEARQRAETQYKELKRLDEERQRLLQKCSSQTEGMHFGHAFFAAGVQSDSRHSEEASCDNSDRHVSSDSENVDRDGMAKPQERAGPRRATIRDEKENSEDTRRPGEGQSGTPPAPPRGSEAAPDTPQSAGLLSTVGDPDREGNAVNERTEERQRVEAEPKDERSRDVLIERLRRLYSEECASSRRLAAEGAKYRQQLRQVMKRLVVVTKAMEEANDLREKRQRMQQQKRRGKVSSE
ncbi:putative trichohyalin, partial [Toxoplasma gondii p89]